MKSLLLFIFIILSISALQAQDNYRSTEITDRFEHLNEKLWKWDYSIKDQLGNKLVVEGREIGIFINNDLIKVADVDTLSLDQLGSGRIFLVFSSVYPFHASILEPEEKIASVVVPGERSFYGYSNFTSFYITLMLVFLAVIKWNQGRELNEYLRIARMFSPRNSDENILRNKLMSYSNLQFVLFFNLLVSGGIVSFLNLSSDRGWTFGELVVSWLMYFGLFGIFLIAKWAIISFMSFVFNFGGFMQIHIVNYLRISAFFAILWTLWILAFTWWAPTSFSPIFLTWAVSLSAVLRMLVLYLKLNNEESYRGFHLFSYLCATEIIPFFGVLYFTSGFFIE